jgi:hypothetical protein
MEFYVIIVSLAVGLVIMVGYTMAFISKAIAKRRIEKKDVKSWLRNIADAFWGIG